MPRLYFCLRMLAVALASPAIAIYIVGATLFHAIWALGRTSRPARVSGARAGLRIWLSVLDWIKGIPVGYSYWVRYEAPVMLDEIEVHHDE